MKYVNGVFIGFEIPSLLAVCENLGYDKQSLLHLIEFIEDGILSVMRESDGSN